MGCSEFLGSPPRVRGKDNLYGLLIHCPGITPACAGKSLLKVERMFDTQDHPRVCGEKLYYFPRFHYHIGSPPRVRGKVVACGVIIFAVGITPACAGKSCMLVSISYGSGDHPRVCGEKIQRPQINRINAGSPPRVRGKVLGEMSASQFTGITPACAGKRQHHQQHFRQL